LPSLLQRRHALPPRAVQRLSVSLSKSSAASGVNDLAASAVVDHLVLWRIIGGSVCRVVALGRRIRVIAFDHKLIRNIQSHRLAASGNGRGSGFKGDSITMACRTG
jgi:hypothetical protein